MNKKHKTSNIVTNSIKTLKMVHLKKKQKTKKNLKKKKENQSSLYGIMSSLSLADLTEPYPC